MPEYVNRAYCNGLPSVETGSLDGERIEGGDHVFLIMRVAGVHTRRTGIFPCVMDEHGGALNFSGADRTHPLTDKLR